MIKITEFAKLANTTRRTLIFYDKNNIFKPYYIAKNGYRYYTYDQLYQFSLIIGLRNLGLPIEEIKMIQNNIDAKGLEERFVELRKQVDEKIEELIRIQTVLNRRLKGSQHLNSLPLKTPCIEVFPKQTFWCSEKLVNCKQEEIAKNYVNFYNKLNPMVIVDNMDSGFLTDLPVNKYSTYMFTSFRFLKEVNIDNILYMMPFIEKPAGKYLIIKVKNTLADISEGLSLIHNYCLENNLILGEDLWQLNTDGKITQSGSSAIEILQYRIINKH